tara:strand:+ start:3342 stop:3899 length:558 start_codon:yes stop_codon:yes gene_type:complete
MKTLLALLITTAAFAQSSGLDALGADTLGDSQSSTPALGTVAKVEQKVTEGVKMKCDAVNGCALFIDEGKGFEPKVSIGAGEGPNYGTNGGGINIYSGSSSEQYYGLAITFTYYNFKCIRYVPEGTYRVIETYQHLMASQEYVSKVFAAWKKGEDMPTPDAVKTALAVLATVKPSQNNCGQRLNN